MPGTRHIESYRAVAQDPHAFATTLVTCLIDAYGTEALSWSPDTIRMETAEDWHVRWTRQNFDRLMAGVALLRSNSFYKSLPDFVELCQVLSGAPFSPNHWTPADVDDCAWGATEALLLSPPDEDDPAPFSDEVRHYVGAMLKEEGIVNPPDILKIALHDEDLAGRVREGFSDDALMSEGIWKMEAEKTDDINDLIKGRLHLMIRQLASLRLANGDTSDIARKMLANLNARPRGGSALTGVGGF